VLIGFLLVALIVIPLLPYVSLTEPPSAKTLWLKSSDVDRVETMLGEHPTLTDDNLREIATMEFRNVLGLPRSPRSVPANQVTRTLFLLLPLSVVFACVLVLFRTCYPSGVFLWGDEVERYANILQRRKIL
jgi:hypothetical protein